jgi:hypothetical protein
MLCGDDKSYRPASSSVNGARFGAPHVKLRLGRNPRSHLPGRGSARQVGDEAGSHAKINDWHVVHKRLGAILRLLTLTGVRECLIRESLLEWGLIRQRSTACPILHRSPSRGALRFNVREDSGLSLTLTSGLEFDCENKEEIPC